MTTGSWIRRALAVVVCGISLVVGWRWSGGMTGMRPPGAMDPPWRGGPGPTLDLTPLTPLAGTVVVAVLVGLVLLGFRPRIGYALAVAGLLGYSALGGAGPAMILPTAILAASLLMRTGLARGWPWLLAVPVVVWSTSWDDPLLGLGAADTWNRITVVSLWVLAPALILTVVRMRRHAAEQARREELRQAAQDERLRVARDIHDVVGHSLSMISLQSGVALRVLETDPAQARMSLEAIRSASKDALA
ncbi:MAG: sensor histidine kinase, partial [Propioniciclava sp.]